MSLNNRDYVEAKGICLEALGEFSADIDIMLPDMRGEYLFEWDMEDCDTVKNLIDDAIDKILSTCMVHHVANELRTVQSNYAAAVKSKNIRLCQRRLEDAMEAFGMVFEACKAVREF